MPLGANAPYMNRHVDEEDKGVAKVRTPGGEQPMTALTDLFRGTAKNSGDRPRTEFDTVRELMPGCYVPAESAARVIGRATGKAFSPASRDYIGRHHRVGR